MKKILILSIFALSILGLSACGQTDTPDVLPGTLEPINETPTTETTTDARDNDCPEVCADALPKCASLTENDCLYQCQNATNLEKACLKNFQTCDELAKKCRQPSSAPTTSENDNNCVAACNNYVLQCISLVPGASQALETDSYNSCMSECAKWNAEKINCMSISPNCESFTTQCGL